jgi:hypothetical protein
MSSSSSLQVFPLMVAPMSTLLGYLTQAITQAIGIADKLGLG